MRLPDPSEAAFRQFVRGLPSIDEVAVVARGEELAERPCVGATRELLDLAIRLTDLTTLEGTDTPERVRALAARAISPDPADATCPPVAALCVYSDLAPVAVEVLAPTGVRVAAVAGAFPSGRAPLAAKLAEVTYAVAAGVDEVDTVIDRGAVLAGRYGHVLDELRALREACSGLCLKVILETSELETLDNVRTASWLAMLAGADFLKTSTGKVHPSATLPGVLVMLEAAHAFHDLGGRRVGVKAAGGIRTASQALPYLAAARGFAGDTPLAPDHFRLGASTLLATLVQERAACD